MCQARAKNLSCFSELCLCHSVQSRPRDQNVVSTQGVMLRYYDEIEARRGDVGCLDVHGEGSSAARISDGQCCGNGAAATGDQHIRPGRSEDILDGARERIGPEARRQVI